jgi:hypothetical protein
MPITSFKVKGGEVSGFHKIAPGARITFTVTLPDSDCTAAVSARVGDTRRDGRVNLCDKGGYVITQPKAAPGSCRSPKSCFARPSAGTPLTSYLHGSDMDAHCADR